MSVFCLHTGIVSVPTPGCCKDEMPCQGVMARAVLTSVRNPVGPAPRLCHRKAAPRLQTTKGKKSDGESNGHQEASCPAAAATVESQQLETNSSPVGTGGRGWLGKQHRGVSLPSVSDLPERPGDVAVLPDHRPGPPSGRGDSPSAGQGSGPCVTLHSPASGPSSWLLPPPPIPDPQEVRCLLPHTCVPGCI